MADDLEVEYRYVKGHGWVAGYTNDNLGRILRQAAKSMNFGTPYRPGTYEQLFQRLARYQGDTFHDAEEWFINRQLYRR